MAPRGRKIKTWSCSQTRCSKLSNESVSYVKPNITFATDLNRNLVAAKLGKQTVNCLIDSGATISCINKYVLDKCYPDATVYRSNLDRVVGVCGETHPVLGETTHPFNLGGLELRSHMNSPQVRTA